MSEQEVRNLATAMLKALRAAGALLALVSAWIHLDYGFFRPLSSLAAARFLFAPISLAFDVIGILDLIVVFVLVRGLHKLYLPSLVYTATVIVVYLIALLSPIPGFTGGPLRPSSLAIAAKTVEVALIAILGVLVGLKAQSGLA